LPFRGELVVHEACREVREHDGYFVVSDRNNPRFHWGNYVHLRNVPGGKDIGYLEGLHEEELPHVGARFIFTWNDDLRLSLTTDRLKELFADAGYGFETSICMVATPDAVKDSVPRAHDVTCDVREIRTDGDWQKALENQLLCRRQEGGEEHIFVRMRSARDAVERGRGLWMGAFEGERLVGDLGVFWSGNLCRFQAIGTRPSHRGRGIATQMVVEAVRRVSQKVPDPTFVILTALDGAPRRIYERCGFEPVANHVGATKLDGPTT
jgi:GNAT superfamily N-acetyltransferase